MSLIAALAISALSFAAGAAYENTHNNTGDQAQDIVSIAQTQVGYAEGGDGYTKYGDWYGMPNADWCAMFVSWCANQAGVDSSVFQRFALCSAGADWFIANGSFHYSGSYVPQAGDLIFYASYGNIYHVGLVTGSDGYNVYSIEGNYNEMVSNVSYSLSYGDILGYATPNYSTSGGWDTTDVPDDDTESDSYTDSDIVDVTDDEDSDWYDDTESDVYTDDEIESVIESDDDTETVEDSEADTDEEITDTETDTDTESDILTDTEDTDTDAVQYQLGDVNGDGFITPADAVLIQRHMCELTLLDDSQQLIADVDGSGKVDIIDVILILNMAVGVSI